MIKFLLDSKKYLKKTNKLRFRSNDEKKDIIKKYNSLKKDKTKWLKARGLYALEIADWRKNLDIKF